MTVQLEYTAQLKRAAGTAREEIAVQEPATLSAVLANAAARHGEDFRRLLLTADGGPQPSLLLFVADAQVPAGDDPEIRPGDVVTIMSPISGG